MPDSDQNWRPDVLSQLLIRVESQQFQINELREFIREKCITKSEIYPIKAIAYGIVSIFMAAVLTAIATLVVTKR